MVDASALLGDNIHECIAEARVSLLYHCAGIAIHEYRESEQSAHGRQYYAADTLGYTYPTLRVFSTCPSFHGRCMVYYRAVPLVYIRLPPGLSHPALGAWSRRAP